MSRFREELKAGHDPRTATGDHFWPVWVALPLAVGVHAVVRAVMRYVRSFGGLAIHAGVTALAALYLTAIWLVTTPGGYFWPLWPIMALALALGIHTVVAYVRRGERVEELTSTAPARSMPRPPSWPGSSATCTTVPRRALWRWRWTSAWPRRSSPPTPRRLGRWWARRGPRPVGLWSSSGTWPAASTLRC